MIFHLSGAITNDTMKSSVIRVLFFVLCFITIAFKQKDRIIILATTTSVQDSGLLDEIVPIFEKETGYFVKVVAVGSGQALAMGRRGEADILFVHSPLEELEFMSQKFGTKRTTIMYNSFLLVGPKNDPAMITTAKNIQDAMKKISISKATFISRSDKSGTHTKEMSLWSSAGLNPVGKRWYHETGTGMGQTLAIASEKQAYTLSDAATFLAMRKNLDLAALYTNDELLKNYYSVIEINCDKFPKVNCEGAKNLSVFLRSEHVHNIIKHYGEKKYGDKLFTPIPTR